MKCSLQEAEHLFSLLEKVDPFNSKIYVGWVALDTNQRGSFALSTTTREIQRAVNEASNNPFRYSVRALYYSARTATIAKLPPEKFSCSLGNDELLAQLLRESGGKLNVTVALTWSTTELLLRGEALICKNKNALHELVMKLSCLTAAFASYNDVNFGDVLAEVQRKVRKASPNYESL